MNRFKNLALGLSLVTVAAAGAPAGALAADAPVTGSITGGDLSLTTAATPSFSATLNGTNQAKTYTIPSVLTDTRGSGAGWNTTITSTQFVSGSRTLATSASTMTSLVNTCASGGAACTIEDNAVALPVGVPAAAVTAPTAVKYHNAAADSGLGTFDHTPTVSVALPATTFAGSYTSTVTLASVSGP